jgi:predicted metalloprotease
MRLEDEPESANIEDRRGAPARAGFGGRKLGLWAIVIALVAAYFGIDPRLILGVLSIGGPVVEQHSAPAPASQPAVKDEASVFVSKVLGNTEHVWQQVFRGLGQAYREPTLVMFSGATPSACGLGQGAMGPFYCPLDQKVYIDLRFFDELQQRYAAPGDFARAYVLAHEVGHHVQKLLGISDKVQALQQRSGEAQANLLSVRLELQADCLAGVWANRAHEWRNILEPGDIEEGLRAAAAVGDDTLQRRTKGYVIRETFTHGSSAERSQWFRKGLQTGDVSACDTFSR